MKAYLDLLSHVMSQGEEREDRTGIGTTSCFGTQTRYDITDNFPLLTTKRVFWRGVLYELLWFLSGSTNIRYLTENKVNFWNANAYDYFIKRLRKEEIYDYVSQEEFEELLSTRKHYLNPVTGHAALLGYRTGDLGPVYGH